MSFEQQGISSTWTALVAFAVIGVGGIGSLIMGPVADRFGRTTVTIALMLTSGTMSLLIGFLHRGNPILLVVVALVWGFSVVADSAQFSAAVSELAPSKNVGTALTLQTSMGFLLTLFSIRLIPLLVEIVGWQFAFAILALGPAAGIWAMWTLQNLPTAKKLAGGRG